MSWRLTINGVTKTLAEWRVNDVQLVRASLQPDRLTFNAPRKSWDEDPLCAYGAEVTLLNAAGVVWFRGTRQLVPQQASAASQSQDYSFTGPLRWLAENVYQQRWFNNTYTSHAIVPWSIGRTVKEVLNFAIANGAQLAYVAGDLDVLNAYPPAAEFTEKSCLAVVIDTLQFAPDIQGWLDYSTAVPTLRFQRRDALAAVSLRMADHDDAAMLPIEVVSLTPRPDRQVPSVKINFERIDEIDGQQILVPSTDAYPPGATGLEDGALNATVTLQGRTVTNVLATLDCVTIEEDTRAWWLRHVPTMGPGAIVVTSGPTNVRAYDDEGNLTTIYPRELPKDGGQIADWMKHSNGQPLAYRAVTLKAIFGVTEVELTAVGGVPLPLPVKVDTREVVVEILTTDAPAGRSTYRAEASGTEGDPVIVGLAQFLHSSLSPLRYDGSFSLAEAVCSGAVNIGNAVNLFGSRPEYQAMRASVSQVTFHLDLGRTQIDFGPARALELNQLLALLQRFRVRRSWTNPDTQVSGEIGSSDGSQVTLGHAVGGTNSLPGASTPSLAVVKTATAAVTQDATNKKFLIDFGDGKKVTIDAAAAAWLANKELAVREYGVCVKINNVDTQKKALFIATDYYD